MPQSDRLIFNGRVFWGGSLEQILIEKAQKGDRAAFSQLLDLHYVFVRSVAWRWCGRTCDVDDVAQDVCIRLAKSLDRFRGDGQFKTWLYTLTINVARDHLRKLGRETRNLQIWADDPTTVSLHAGADETRLDDVWAAVRTLPPKQCDAVLLVYAEGLSHAQAAEVLHCSESTVSWQVHEAKKKLKQMLVEG